MKTWIIAATLLLATATFSHAEWLRCETIQIIPGFTIQSCESSHRYGRHDHYSYSYKNWGQKKKYFARHRDRQKRYYYGKRWHNKPPGNHHGRHDTNEYSRR